MPGRFVAVGGPVRVRVGVEVRVGVLDGVEESKGVSVGVSVGNGVDVGDGVSLGKGLASSVGLTMGGNVIFGVAGLSSLTNAAEKVGVIFGLIKEYPLKTTAVTKHNNTIKVNKPDTNNTLRLMPLRFGFSSSPNVLSRKGSFSKFSWRSCSIGVNTFGG